MPLTDFGSGAPDGVWAVFEPVPPPAAWKGVGRKPEGNRECLHASPYAPAAGTGGQLLPAGFPGSKAVRRRLARRLAPGCFHTARARLAERYGRLHGINWGRVPLGGPEEPSKKGAKTPGRLRWVAVSVVRPPT
jgi:transposase